MPRSRMPAAPVSAMDLFDDSGKFKLLTNLPKRVRSRLLRVKTDDDGRICGFEFKPRPMMGRAPVKRRKKRITKAMERELLRRLDQEIAYLQSKR